MKLPLINRKLLAVIITAVAILSAGAGLTYAADNTGGETANHTIYRFGRDITITGTVNGDVICGGQNITIDATVNGDVLCAGQTVSINGPVNGDVRAAGQNVDLRSKVERNVSLAGQSITVSGRVGQDAGLAGTDITVSGIIGRDLRLAGDDLTISGQVGRDVVSNSGDLTLTSRARISGNLTQTGPREPHKQAGAVVTGRTVFHEEQQKHRDWWGPWLAWQAFMAITLTILTLILVALFPRLFRRAAGLTYARFWLVLLTGFVAVFLVPVLIITLAVTVIGIVPAVLLGLLWLTAGILSAPIAAFLVGNRLAPDWHPVLAALLGCAILGLLSLIPFLGALTSFIAYLVGVGSLLWTAQAAYHRPDYTA